MKVWHYAAAMGSTIVGAGIAADFGMTGLAHALAVLACCLLFLPCAVDFDK